MRKRAVRLITERKGANASAILDGAAVGIPAAIGAEAKGSRGRGRETKIEGGDDFVFAYQLKKLVYSKKKKPVKVTDSVEGALFGDHGEEVEELDEFEVDMVEDGVEVGLEDVERIKIPGAGKEGIGEVCIIFNRDEDDDEDDDDE